MRQPTQLHLVGSSDADAPSRSKGSEKSTRWQGHDDIFFHKEQIKLGTKLLYFGRIDHATLWVVEEIKSYHLTASGKVMGTKVEQVQKLTDDITVRRMNSNEWRMLRFSSLSYQATWRIASE